MDGPTGQAGRDSHEGDDCPQAHGNTSAAGVYAKFAASEGGRQLFAAAGRPDLPKTVPTARLVPAREPSFGQRLDDRRVRGVAPLGPALVVVLHLLAAHQLQ